MSTLSPRQKHLHRARRVRAKITGTAERPRLAVYRSNRAISAQIIDDTIGKTIVAASSRQLTKKEATPLATATAVGALIAEKAKAAKITSVRFDRRHYKYHGQVKALADGARTAGLQF